EAPGSSASPTKRTRGGLRALLLLLEFRVDDVVLLRATLLLPFAARLLRPGRFTAARRPGRLVGLLGHLVRRLHQRVCGAVDRLDVGAGERVLHRLELQIG